MPSPYHSWGKLSRSGRQDTPILPQRMELLADRSLETMSVAADRLLEEAEDDDERARLLLVSAPESGAWLRALPFSSMGLHMDNDTVRIAIGLYV